VIATAQLMVVLDATIVNVALPHIQRALGFPDRALSGQVARRRECRLKRAEADTVAAPKPGQVRAPLPWHRRELRMPR
jgi:hypothetical protein